jgi:acetate---CoA ligase (ADP-forming)
MSYEIPKLRPLLIPRSIAVVGASPDPEKAISKYVNQLISNGYEGDIYPINPKYQEVYGFKCFPSVKSIPGEVDTASIALRNDTVLEALEECAQKGVKSAIVFSAGFAEIGENGRKLQEGIGNLARRTGMRILGPNCNGVINVNDRVVMAMFFYGDMKEQMIPGNISLISQSGTIPLICFANAHERGIGYRCLVSVGNEADLDVSDLIAYMVEDEQTKVVTGYIEGFRDVKKFMNVMDFAHQRKKPVILLHVTRYDASLRAAKYHTAAYTEAGYEFASIFRDKNVLTVEEPDELMEWGTLFSLPKVPKGDKVGIMNTTGGLTVFTADVSSELGLNLSRLSDSTRAMLKDLLKFGTPNNPLDLTGQVANDPDLFRKALRAFVEDDQIDILVVSMFLWRKHMEYRVDSVIEFSKQTEKPILVLWMGSNIGGDSARKLLRANIPVFRTVRTCLRGVQAWIQYSKFVRQ